MLTVPSLEPAARRSPGVVRHGVHVLPLWHLALALAGGEIPNRRLAVPTAGGEVDAIGRRRRGVQRRGRPQRFVRQLGEVSQATPFPVAQVSGHSASSSTARSNEFSSSFALVSPMRAT